MEAPDKITIHKYNITKDGNVVFAWVDNSPECEPMNHPVEYVRADSFIRKACKYLNRNCRRFILTEKDIEDFKNYMKGE